MRGAAFFKAFLAYPFDRARRIAYRNDTRRHGGVAQTEAQRLVDSYFWWHSIDFGGGLTARGAKPLKQMRREAALLFDRLDLNGRSVLDVGAWNGGFSLEAARRGAARVVGLDHATWRHPEFRGRETFDLVARLSGAPLEAVDIDLGAPQLSLAALGGFDVVLFSGVFYHLIDPIAALREVAALAREALIVETHVERLWRRRPAMVFYPGDERLGDPSNWWGPNEACMVALLRHFGFRRIERARNGARDRMTFHAFRV